MQRFWKIKKGGKRSFINWNEHRETKNEHIGTKTVLRVKKELLSFFLKTDNIKNSKGRKKRKNHYHIM